MPHRAPSALERLVAAIRRRLDDGSRRDGATGSPAEGDEAPGADAAQRVRSIGWVLGLVLLIVGIAVPGLAADGDLDPTFSDLGAFQLDSVTGFETARDLVALDSGEVVGLIDGSDHVRLLKLSPAGEPVLGFGTDGLADVSDADRRANTMTTDAAGGFIVAGAGYNPVAMTNTPWLARVDADGELDSTFGTDGYAVIGDSSGEFHDVATDSAGRIVGIGNMFEDIVVARFTPDGDPDPSFGTGGLLTLPNGANGRAVHGLVQTTDAIIVAGAIATDDSDVFVLRVTEDGEVDPTFPTVVLNPLGTGFFERVSAIRADPNGRIVIIGFAESAGVDSFLIRLLPDGVLDRSLAGVGMTRIEPLDEVTALGLAVDASHRIIVAGNGLQPGETDRSGFVTRLGPNGLPDLGFGDGGVTVIDPSDGFDSTVALAATAEHVFAGGTTDPGGEPHLLITAHTAPLPDPTFDDIVGSPFQGDIEAIAAAGITVGCDSAGNYCPDDPVTRGQMAAFLVRGFGYTDDGGGDVFADDDTSTFEADIDRLATAGVTLGCDEAGNFCPADLVTRGQMAAFLVRAIGLTAGAGDDLFIDDDQSVFEADIDRLARAGITRGCDDARHFCPTDNVTRSQMAAFLARALGLD